jgi:hypothetical protein
MCTRGNHVARKHMIRLEPPDLQDPEMREKLAQVARVTPQGLTKTFAGAVTSAQGRSYLHATRACSPSRARTSDCFLSGNTRRSTRLTEGNPRQSGRSIPE